MTQSAMVTESVSEPRRSREFEFELPVGYLDENGCLHRTARLRKMTGHEEALLADRKLRKNGGKLVTELLTSCLRQIGTKKATTQVVAELTSADRNFLLLELRKITFGTELEARYTCPACGDVNAVSEDLDALPVRRTDGDAHPEIVVELADGYEDKDGNYYDRAVFRLPTGADEERIAGELKDNPSRGMNALLARCLTAFGDMPEKVRQGLGTKLLADLTLQDRARIERALREQMPGVDLRRAIECAACDHKFSVSMDLTSFFSPG
ncbi:MAG TPA: hypothetical protein VIM73_21575 [Polyangiaceae bacterium]